MNGKKLMMAAAGGGAGPEYIGSVTKISALDYFWDSGNRADVLSIAETGDLVVMAITADRNTSGEPFQFGGMSFQTADPWWEWNDLMHGQVGFRIVQSGDSNPYITTPIDGARAITAVFSVFRGFTTYSDPAKSQSFSGSIDPPSLTAAGDLWIATAHLDAQNEASWTAPSGYTLAAYKGGTFAPPSITGKSTTALAYKIETLTSDNPSVFSAGSTDSWVSFTLAASL